MENVAFLPIASAIVLETSNISVATDFCGVLNREIVSPVVKLTVGVKWIRQPLPQPQLPPPPHQKNIVIKSVGIWRMASMENAAKKRFATVRVMETLNYDATRELSGVLNRMIVCLAVRWTVAVRSVVQQLTLEQQQVQPQPQILPDLSLIVTKSAQKWEMTLSRENVAYLTTVCAKVMETLRWSAMKMELCGVLNRIIVSLAVRWTVAVRWIQLLRNQHQPPPQHQPTSPPQLQQPQQPQQQPPTQILIVLNSVKIFKISLSSLMDVARLNTVFAFKEQALCCHVNLMELYSVLNTMPVFYQTNVNQMKDAVTVKFLLLRHQRLSLLQLPLLRNLCGIATKSVSERKMDLFTENVAKKPIATVRATETLRSRVAAREISFVHKREIVF